MQYPLTLTPVAQAIEVSSLPYILPQYCHIDQPKTMDVRLLTGLIAAPGINAEFCCRAPCERHLGGSLQP